MVKKIILFLWVALCLVGCKQHEANAPIKIGAVLELTGPMSEIGTSGKNAAEMAVKEVNDTGGLVIHGKKTPLELVIEDNAADPKQTVTVIKKLIKQDHVLAIVGPNVGVGAIPASEMAEEEKVPLIVPWSTAVETTVDSKTGEHKLYVFRVCFSDIFQGRILANFARYTKNYKTAAVLYEAESTTPASQARFFKQNFEKLGGKVIAFESYKKGSKDFSAQLARIKAANPQILLLPDYYTDVALIAQQARKLGIHADFLGSDNWNRPQVELLAQKALEGAYFISHYSPDDNSKLTQTFVKKYRALYGDTPDDVAALTYDGYQLLFKAITTAKKLTHAEIRESLVALPLLEGVTGTIDYRESFSGEPSKSAVIDQIRDGKFVWIAHANP